MIDMKRRSLLSCVTLILATPFAVVGETVRIYVAKDTTIYSDRDESGEVTNHSNGVGEGLYAGKNGRGFIRRALLQFAVEGILPKEATIKEATRILHGAGGNVSEDELSLHRLAGDWGESGTSSGDGEGKHDGSGDQSREIGSSGGGGGAPATPGDATWTFRFYDEEKWDEEGGDFMANASATKILATLQRCTIASEGLAKDVRFWIENPDRNYGWILRGNEGKSGTAKVFESAQSSNEERRPVLLIVYGLLRHSFSQ